MSGLENTLLFGYLFEVSSHLIGYFLKLRSYIWQTGLNGLSVFSGLVEMGPPFLSVMALLNLELVGNSLSFTLPLIWVNGGFDNSIILAIEVVSSEIVGAGFD